MSERLPVHEALPALREALREGRNAVLEAPPGAGKSTVVPLALLEEPWARGRRVLLLEPRRLAARAVAARMAQRCASRLARRWAIACGLTHGSARARGSRSSPKAC